MIKRLNQKVVEKISSGQVITSPSNCVKELLENSIDAKGSSLTININDCYNWAIADNGIGILYEDLSLLCNQYTTSKLVEFDDLLSIATYGFRGEALNSVSYLSDICVITSTDGIRGYKCKYKESTLLEIEDCASTRGTTLAISNLFGGKRFNSKREVAAMIDLIGKYAINNSGVSFTIRNNKKTIVLKNESCAETIKELYSHKLELKEFHFQNKELHVNQCDGFLGNNTLSQLNFILFLNNRLVQCKQLKKAVADLLHNYNQPHSFLYISLHMTSHVIDVNVHPSKEIVYILNESAVVDFIVNSLQELLAENIQSFTFKTKIIDSSTSIVQQPQPPQSKLRCDSKQMKLDSFRSKSFHRKEAGDTQRQVNLKSIFELKTSAVDASDENFSKIVHSNIFIGQTCKYYLFQSYNALFICNDQLILELFYQVALYEFMNYGVIQVQVDLKRLIGSDKAAFLQEKSQLLRDYFRMHIQNNSLLSLPLLFHNYEPSMSRVKLLLERLCLLNWKEEKECLQGIFIELALFYWKPEMSSQELQIVFEAMKNKLFHCPADAMIVEVANVEGLYKVFERC